jgi:hypothetical protein
MAKQCEACAQLALRGGRPLSNGRVRNLLVEGRLVYLCDAHVQAVGNPDLCQVECIRQLLRETEGQRSLVTRRSPIDRRVFPPRPEGRRLATGRRSTDGDC